MKNERAYLCDGYGCNKKCAESLTPEEWSKYYCHHTLDEKHAKTKCRRNRKFTCSDGKYMEITQYDKIK